MRDFKKIIAWEKAHNFVLDVYSVTNNFPKSEIYGVISQLRRVAVSIPKNISEGCGRNTKKELFDFLNVSMGAASEVEYLLLLCRDLECMKLEEFHKLSSELIEVRKMLNVYMQKIEEDIYSANGNKF